MPGPRQARAVPASLLLSALASLLCGCVSGPGEHFTRAAELSPAHEANPALSAPARASAQGPASAFRLYSVGTDGLLLRLELIEQAQRSLDLQYYIFHGDESGRLITEALLKAAARGVRVRVLVDDGESVRGDEQLFALAGAPHVAIRVFNPWRYRGHNGFVRAVEFLFNRRRLDYRMHNKLFVADGRVALVGGRNIGNQYFQVAPDSQYADDDVLATGEVTAALADAFQEYWDSPHAVPVEAFTPARERGAAAAQKLAQRHTTPELATRAAPDFSARLLAGEPLHQVLSGAAPLSWAAAELACDSPDKAQMDASRRVASYMFGPVAQAIRGTRHELTLVTPYLIPTRAELELLEATSRDGRQLRILTTSLEATTDPAAQAGYSHYRVPLLESGAQLYELRRAPQSPRGTGQSARMSRYGNFGLHAKLLVFDDAAIYVGSMNYDARSRWLNTEIGLIVQSPELAGEVQQRFAAMTRPENAYHVTLLGSPGADPPGQPAPHRPQLQWSAVEAGAAVSYTREPARSLWQRALVRLLALLPIDHEL